MAIDPEVQSRFDGIDLAIAEIKTALVGNPTMGHKGIIARIETLELLNAEVPGVHVELENRQKEAREKIHSRIDELEEQTSQRISALASEWTRFKYLAIGIAIGSGIAGGVAGARLVSAFGG